MPTPGQVLRTTISDRLSLWRRSALPGLAIPDPGHGLDEISPVVEYGVAFDDTNDDDTAPFQASQVSDYAGDTAIIPGTGYLVWMLRHLHDDVAVPGEVPELLATYALDFWIKTPAARGGELATLYTSALNALFSGWAAHPGGDVVEIADDDPPPELPVADGHDAHWRYDKHTIPLTMHYRVRPA